MEEVLLTSDILIHYFAKSEVENPQRHEQATAVMERVLAGQLTAHISDIVLFKVAKFLENVQTEELDWDIFETKRESLRDLSHNYEAYMKALVQEYLRPLLGLQNVILLNRMQWEVTLDFFAGYELSLEDAYHAAMLAIMELEERREIQGYISFDQTLDYKLEFITTRIDPATFS